MFDILWKRMDELVDEFNIKKAMEDPSKKIPWAEAKELTELRGQMIGLAFAIKALYRRSEWWAQALFQDRTEISKHAMARWRALKAGQPFPDTAGCHGHTGIITRSPAELKAATKKTTVPRRRVVLPTVSPETEKQIRAGLAAGFPAKDMADLYKVPLATVETYR
jgi:hypothetical protein